MIAQADPIPQSEGLLFHHPELRRSGCVGCGWSGSPTTVGGRRVGRPRHYFRAFPPGYRVVGSRRLDICPHCESEPLQQLLEHVGGTRRREGLKVGRNDPCPCGSGRKFKRCCLEAA